MAFGLLFVILLPVQRVWAEDFDPFAQTDAALAGGEEFSEDITETHSLLDDVTVTLCQEYAYGVSRPVDRTVVNRSSARGEMGTSLGRGVFFRFDGNAHVYWMRDHRSDSEDGDVATGGDIREVYLQKENDRMSVKVGRQVVVWGETNGGVITDVVSPRDEKEFVFTELEDARLGQALVSLSLYSDWGDLFSFMTLESRVNDIPDQGDRYDPASGNGVIRDNGPRDSDREFGVKWKKAFHRFDLALMAASLVQNSGVLDTFGEELFTREYPRYRFYGLGARYTMGNVLFNLDASLKDRYGLQAVDVDGAYRVFTGRVSDSALGIDYDANGAFTLSMELVHRHVLESVSGLDGLDKSSSGLYLSWSSQFLHDTLTIEFNSFYQFKDDHGVHQFKMEHTYSDHVTWQLDYTAIHAKDMDSSFWFYRNEDRVGIKVMYWL